MELWGPIPKAAALEGCTNDFSLGRLWGTQVSEGGNVSSETEETAVEALKKATARDLWTLQQNMDKQNKVLSLERQVLAGFPSH